MTDLLSLLAPHTTKRYWELMLCWHIIRYAYTVIVGMTFWVLIDNFLQTFYEYTPDGVFSYSDVSVGINEWIVTARFSYSCTMMYDIKLSGTTTAAASTGVETPAPSEEKSKEVSDESNFDDVFNAMEIATSPDDIVVMKRAGPTSASVKGNNRGVAKGSVMLTFNRDHKVESIIFKYVETL